MIPADAVRAALAAENPFAAIDSLIRAALAAGHRVAQVYDHLVDLMPEATTWPEYTGDGSDAFDGALDALSGNCHPDCCYTDAVIPSNGTAVNGRHSPEDTRIPHR